jgi:TonB-linked SusC/RagA family outer membrane protein
MKRKSLLLLAFLFASIGLITAQVKRVTGTVISEEDGEPIVGASVLVKGTTLGTVTDLDGQFTISEIPSSSQTLVVSYIGMQSQEVTAKAQMRIVLKADTEVLDEVIVVAFGTAKKSSFTGAATVVGSEELSKHVTTNVANALVGSTPGLQLRGGSGAPGASQGSIQIRGIASMYADTDPLIVVDGAPYSASLSNIPAEDIENITVLKDAASAALYGARGAAGVILVTTKTGKNKQAQVNVDVKWGATSRAVQDYETINDPGQYYETIYGQYYNYYYYGQGMGAAAANQQANSTMLNHLGYNIYTVPDGESLIGLNGKLNPNATMGRSYVANGETYYMTADNWRDAAYKTALRQEYNMSVTGSSDKGSFYASLGYLDEDGVIEYSGYKRISARLKADYQAKKWLKLAANVSYVNSETESNPNMGTSLGSANLMYYTSSIAPIYPIYVRVLDANGNPIIRTDEHGNPQYDYGVAASNYPGYTRAFMPTGNPLGANRYNESLSKVNKLNGNFAMDVNFTDYLKFNATSTLDWGHSAGSYYDTMLYGSKVAVNGEIQKTQSNTIRQNHVQTLTYYNQFGKHSVNAMLGHEYYDIKTTYLSATARGLFSEDILEINAAANKFTSASYTTEYNVEGYFGNVQYNYDDKYFGSASYRRDASSRFAKESRWGNFWSVGGAWILSKEKWFHTSWVDQLKLKASIGQQGNDNIGSWAYTDLYTLTAASDTQMSASFYRIGNKDITWETTTNFNVGVEFSLFGNRLNGTLDYYNKKTTDLLFWLNVPESAGSRGYYANVGDIRNSGVELSLQGTLIHTKNLDWTAQFNISHNSDKILKLPESKKDLLGGFISNSKWYKEGGSLYNYMLAEYAGTNAQGEATYWVDAELGEGVTNRPGKNHSYTTTNVNNATKYEQGSSLPDAYGGFGTSLSAYGFDVSVSFDYQLGGHIYDSQYQSLMSNISDAGDAGSAVHKDVLKAWSTNNTSSSIPRYQYGDQYTAATSNRWLTSASYLNFQSFTVGYTLPKQLLTSWGISKLRVYATGENLVFWSARKGLDPRYAYDTTEQVSVYSPTRTIMGGIQLTF